MDRRAENRFRYRIGWRVLAIAALLLTAQLLAVSHVHQLPSGRSIHTNAQTVADDGLCALCLFHFNCPVDASAPLILAQPAPIEVSMAPTASSRLLLSVKTCLFGRAPPASL